MVGAHLVGLVLLFTHGWSTSRRSSSSVYSWLEHISFVWFFCFLMVGAHLVGLVLLFTHGWSTSLRSGSYIYSWLEHIS